MLQRVLGYGNIQPVFAQFPSAIPSISISFSPSFLSASELTNSEHIWFSPKLSPGVLPSVACALTLFHSSGNLGSRPQQS